MTDVPRGAHADPRRSEPPEMIPAPMPVATLTKMRSRGVRPGGGLLTESHDVDVVVDENGCGESLPARPGQIEAIPARA